MSGIPPEAKKISELEVVATLVGSELFPFIRSGVVADYATTAAAIAALAGGGGGGGITWIDLNGIGSYALSDGATSGQTVAIFDNLGLAPGQTVTGNFNVGGSVRFTEPGQAILFFWNGTLWNVPSWIGLLNG